MIEDHATALHYLAEISNAQAGKVGNIFAAAFFAVVGLVVLWLLFRSTSSD